MVYRKLGLATFLLLVLFLLDGNDNDAPPMEEGQPQQGASPPSSSTRGRVPAVVRALAHHPPSLRIFRALLQVNLVLWCAALCMRMWARTFPIQVLGNLLFAPVDDDDDDDDIRAREGSGAARSVSRSLYKRVLSDHEVESDALETGEADDTQVTIDRSPRSSEPQEDHVGQQNQEDEDLVNVTIGSEKGALLNLEGTATGGEDYDEGDDGDRSEGDNEYDPTPNPTVRIPTAGAIANAAVDMLLLILATLCLFTWTSTGYLASSSPQLVSDASPPSATRALSRIAAPTFPLLLFVYCVVVAVTPWKHSRRNLWKLVYRTTMAPYYAVTFRDGFLGDVLTSSVRPMQDVAFTLFYIGAGLQGWWSWPFAGATLPFASGQETGGTDPSTEPDSFLDRADAGVPLLEKSWIYYTVVLPMCVVSPLWWRFLQNVRQSLDARQRWPFLGNAAKYFCAAQVAVVGIFFPSQRHTAWWLFAFALATLYQIWWDIFMDWNLLEHRNYRWQLRQRRAYQSTRFYWIICGINILLRFCWTLTFLPARYLDAAGNLRQSLGSDAYVNVVLSPLVASAEIVRRSLWGLIRLEWEAVKNQGDANDALEQDRRGDPAIELTPMKLGDGDFQSMDTYTMRKPSRISIFGKDMSEMTEGQILRELGAYSTVFAVLGALAAAHRETQ